MTSTALGGHRVPRPAARYLGSAAAWPAQVIRWPHWRSAVTVGASLLRSSLPNGRRWNKGQLLTIRALVDHHPPRLRKTRGDEFQCHRATALLAIWNVRRGLLILHGQISRPLRQALFATNAVFAAMFPREPLCLVGHHIL